MSHAITDLATVRLADSADTPLARPPERVAADATAEPFAQLYRALLPPVLGYVRYRIADRQAAEDVTALVFERALARLATVRDPHKVRPWLFGIARNAVTDYYRRKRPAADLDTVEHLEHLWVDSPEGAAIRADDWQRVARGLADLDERSRDVLGLKYAAGLGHAEIGRVLGLSESNVAQIAHRAIARLRRRLDAEETRA